MFTKPVPAEETHVSGKLQRGEHDRTIITCLLEVSSDHGDAGLRAAKVAIVGVTGLFATSGSLSLCWRCVRAFRVASSELKEADDGRVSYVVVTSGD